MDQDKLQQIKEQLNSVPVEPGVYLWKDKSGTVIYVGKAKQLRARMRQYVNFQDDRAKIPLLVSQIDSFEYVVTANEHESLVLERNLIEQYSPYFNADFKDDKSYPFIALTKGDVFPAIKYTRESHKATTRYFGPYTDSRAARNLVDIVRRIVKTGEITSTADWQINRLRILGYSSEDIEREIKKTLNASYPEMFELYDKVIEKEYVRDNDVYEQINAEYIPYDQNEQLNQITEAIIDQSCEDLENITNSLGFYLDYGNGRKVLTPLAQVYSGYLDAACYDIVTGAFDYNSVLRRVVTQLTNSGLRKIDYASGRADRVDVAARRAVMTAVSQITGKISEYNAQKLGTEYFEVEWHAGARPTHAVWQGRVWSKEQLYSVCGLGTVTGLLGVNCYHTYYPFFPGLSERNWSDEWLDVKNLEESEPKNFGDKEYTLYEAKQKQRQMELAMRAQREKVRLLQKGKADPDEILLHKAKYQGQLNEYSRFCRKMKQFWEIILVRLLISAR